MATTSTTTGGHDHADDSHAADGHGHHHGVSRATQSRALVLTLGINAAFLVVEVAGGLAFSSLALLADGAHLLSDVAGLGVALVGQRLLVARATATHTYGLQRGEVLAAQANGLCLVAASGWIALEAVRRIGDTASVDGAGVALVAALGLVANLVCAAVLSRARGESLNMRAAYVHMVVDAAGSLAAIAAGVAVVVWGAEWVDPAASLLIVALVLWSAFGLLRDTTRVLLEATPRGMDASTITAALLADPAVEAVHHVHLWNLASDVPALSAHVVVAGEVSLHEAQETGERLKHLLDHDLGIGHATLELECHACE